jgi:ParB family transcriptional regulator, chromosome partitioning protein
MRTTRWRASLSSAASPSEGRRGLGRGLEVLLGGATHDTELAQLPVGAIRPNGLQPRRRYDPEALAGLAESVRVQGVVQPVIVRPMSDGAFELIRPTDDRDSLLLALVENVAREDLSPIEEARAYATLQDEFSLSLGEVAERVGRSKPSVSNRIRLLDLPDDVLGLVERGLLSEGHARAVLAVPDHEERRKLARRIVKQGLSVRAAERAARWAGARTKRRTANRVDPELASRAQRALEGLTGAGVRVGSRRIEIEFRDETELAEIVEALEASAA